MADLAATQQRYAAEAQKRLRPEGINQYVELDESNSERLRQLSGDPWADHAALDALPPRLQAGERIKFLIAGAGLGGIVSAVRLIQQGFSADQIRLVDPAGGAGGTWYWNRYPGLHCDVESYIYLPLLEEVGWVPSHKYAPGVEIRKYLNEVLLKFDLADKVLFRTQLSKVEWDDALKAWKATLTAGRGQNGADKSTFDVEAENVMLTAGLLARPQVPKVGGVGLEGFKGELLHTARWNYETTGGSPEETFPELDKLRGKRVGIIGTGATAIQVVPILAEYAKELYVFQRTPSACYSRRQRRTTPEEWEKIAYKSGWQDERVDNLAAMISKVAPPGTPDLVNDEWSRQKAYSALVGDEQFPNGISQDMIPQVIGHYLALDAENSEGMRKYISEVIHDQKTAEKMTPWYPIWCKRPTFSDTYLQAFNKPNVHLVDTDGKGVQSASETGLTVDGGEEIPLDVLVLATGYRTPAVGAADPTYRAGVQVIGRGGRTFTEKIQAQGPTTLWGCMTNGFPNFFWLGPSQAGVSSNQSQAIDVQARQVAHVIGASHQRAGSTKTDNKNVLIEAEVEGEEAWSMRIMMGAARLATTTVCTPGYINNEGQLPTTTDPIELAKMARLATWSSGILSFARELDMWRTDGKLSGIRVEEA